MGKHHQIGGYSTLPPEGLDKDAIKQELQSLVEALYEKQRLLYADGRHSLLVVFQGLDASGKNSIMRRVFTGVNPLGCRVYNFGIPTQEEYAHDFLRRVHKKCPPKGMIHIFNRSHYEDILVPSVEKTFPKKIIDQRYEHINNFEKLLSDNNTHIVKFFLHVSYEEQEVRLQERIDDPDSHRKHNDSDRKTREKRNEYHKVYEKIFSITNTSYAPWHIIPADKKWYAAYSIGKLLKEKLDKIDLQRPKLQSEAFVAK